MVTSDAEADDMRGGGATLAITLVALALLLARSSVALAHNTGQGQDVGFAQISATVANGVATVLVHVSQASTSTCRKLAPERLAAQRADVVVTGTFGVVGDCAYQGSVAPPAPGRWVVTAAFTLNSEPTSIDIPVGIGGDVTTFAFEDWLHVNSLGGGGRTVPATGLLLGAGGLLALGLVIRVIKPPSAPRRLPKRARSGARPETASLTAAAPTDSTTDNLTTTATAQQEGSQP